MEASARNTRQRWHACAWVSADNNLTRWTRLGFPEGGPSYGCAYGMVQRRECGMGLLWCKHPSPLPGMIGVIRCYSRAGCDSVLLEGRLAACMKWSVLSDNLSSLALLALLPFCDPHLRGLADLLAGPRDGDQPRLVRMML